jgi:transcriptional regulator with XRE-family HTH domain
MLIQRVIVIQCTQMHTSQDGTELSLAKKLGEIIRVARKNRDLTIAQLAEQIGRPREWLNRVELGYSDQGVIAPPSASDLKVIADKLRLEYSPLIELSNAIKEEYNSTKVTRSKRRSAVGKLTNAEVIMGETQIYDVIKDIIAEQNSEAVIRNTGIRGIGEGTKQYSPSWKNYRQLLGQFLRDNPDSLLKRAEYVETLPHLDLAKESDRWLAADRKLNEVDNARIKFFKYNPLKLHILIGQREALIALPHNWGKPGSIEMALVVRDKFFVEALRKWYDDVLWDGKSPNTIVDFADYENSFSEVAKMYGFSKRKRE